MKIQYDLSAKDDSFADVNTLVCVTLELRYDLLTNSDSLSDENSEVDVTCELSIMSC